MEPSQTKKSLTVINALGDIELWLRHEAEEGDAFWFNPLTEQWADLDLVAKLERRLVEQTKREKNMAIIIKERNK